MQNGIKYGVQLGVLTIIITLIQSYVFPNSLISWPSMLLGFGLPILFMVLAAKAEKNANEGILAFGEAFVTAMVTAAVGSLIAALFQFVLFNFINPELATTLAEQTSEAAVNMANKIAEMTGESIPENQLEQMRADTLEQSAGAFSFGGVMVGWITGLIFQAIIALIVAAIVKRNPSA